MTTYDAEIFIAHTLQSILWQTFSDIEILIVDNNSHDNTVAVLKKIASKDARVTIYESKENF
jgi:teichuronic acid biosynthesis glycosyltransferase TuaG